ncbi:MAG: hypothetical protein ABI406_10010, partial [Ktedonobacteraceae bacterium]
MMQTNQSEVARILQQIQLEYEAAERALKGPAFGTARHDFINKKMENMGQCQLDLNELVGPEK